MNGGLIFDGVHSSTFQVMVKSIKPIRAPIINRFLTIPNRDGAYLEGANLDVLAFIIEIGIKAESPIHLHDLKRQIAYWLRPRKEAVPLIFDEDPVHMYYGVPDGAADLERLFRFGRGSFTILIPDSHSHGQENTQIINDPIGSIVNDVIVNHGTADSYPLFRATILEPITLLDIISPDAYIRLGEPVDLEKEVPFVKEERLLWHQCNNLTGWTTASFVDGGVVAGSMVSDSTKFQASGYGTGTAWHGPAIKTSVPNGPLTDFRVDALLGLQNGKGDLVGRVEVYLLDDANKAIAKMALKDTSSSIAAVAGEMRIGDNTINHFLISEYGDARESWNNFYGMLRISRIGKKWTAYIAKIDSKTGKHHTRRTVTFLDEDSIFNKQVSQIAVHVGQLGTRKAAAASIYDIKAFRINQPTDVQIPYIADAGDVIEIDHKVKEIRVNGESRNDIKEFGGSFFPFGVGETQLAVNPPSAATVEAIWRDKWV
ncbi:distal tail protein Dit [Metabacillus idriensis]|uniref:distal tail protein Dit n=1 Tax=Metabacillus idriensis TaxID=324768 RepID=UPI00174EAD70|nr:distal tail protein Dit [Metabacillus idriensis]